MLSFDIEQEKIIGSMLPIDVYSGYTVQVLSWSCQKRFDVKRERKVLVVPNNVFMFGIEEDWC